MQPCVAEYHKATKLMIHELAGESHTWLSVASEVGVEEPRSAEAESALQLPADGAV